MHVVPRRRLKKKKKKKHTFLNLVSGNKTCSYPAPSTSPTTILGFSPPSILCFYFRTRTLTSSNKVSGLSSCAVLSSWLTFPVCKIGIMMPTSKFAVLNFLTYAKHFQECPPGSKSYVNNNSHFHTRGRHWEMQWEFLWGKRKILNYRKQIW